MECPETLAWDHQLQSCNLECIWIFYSENQLRSMFIIDSTFACIGFLLCYFYCFTALFRPVMLHKQSIIVFWMHFCLTLFPIAFFIPLFLGQRYVFCDTQTAQATSKNSACVANAFFSYYFLESFMVWLVLFHVHMTMRLYLVRIPKHIMWFYFFLAFGTWSALTVILGFSLDYVVYPTGGTGCMFFNGSTYYMFGMVVSVFYVCDIILLICVVMIIARMLRLRKATGTPWKTMLAKHFRLLVIWVYHFTFVLLFTVSMAYAEQVLQNTDDLEKASVEYVICVLTAGNADNCEMGEVPNTPFVLLLLTRGVMSFYPILLFLVFGARTSMISFWKEYLAATWKNKRLYLQFTPPFDPSLTVSESHNTKEIRELDNEQEGGRKKRNTVHRIRKAIKDL